MHPIIWGTGKATNFRFCTTFRGSIGKTPIKISTKSSYWRTQGQGLSKIFRAPIYRAHCAVDSSAFLFDQELISYRYSSCCYCWDHTLQKSQTLRRFKSDWDEIWQNCSWSEYTSIDDLELDFRFDFTVSRWRPWRHFTHAKNCCHLVSEREASSQRQFLDRYISSYRIILKWWRSIWRSILSYILFERCSLANAAIGEPHHPFSGDNVHRKIRISGSVIMNK